MDKEQTAIERLRTASETVLHSPADCGTGEATDLTGITEGKFHAGYGFFHIPPQHYHQLFTDDIVIRAESTIAVTADNAISRSPGHCVRIPCTCSHICKWTATTDGGSSLFVVEDLGQLSAGEVSIRGKLGGSIMVCQKTIYSPTSTNFVSASAVAPLVPYYLIACSSLSVLLPS